MTSDCESEFGAGGFPLLRRKKLTRRSLLPQERLDRVAEFAEQLSPPNTASFRYVHIQNVIVIFFNGKKLINLLNKKN
jgi:hypothetical protein